MDLRAQAVVVTSSSSQPRNISLLFVTPVGSTTNIYTVTMQLQMLSSYTIRL